MIRRRVYGVLFSVILTTAAAAIAQTPEPPADPSIISRAAGDRRDEVPNINVYLADGRASIRLRS
jgi:hypothetical protein